MFELYNYMVRISNLDLLKILQKNSRTPAVEIAHRLGVSETAVRKRLRRLEEDGTIRSYTIDADPHKIGYEADSLIGVDAKPESLLEVAEKLGKMPEVLSLYSSSGDHMLMMRCWFRNSKELSRFMKKLKKIEGVTRVCPAVMLEKLK